MPPFPELKDISPPSPPPFSAPEEVQALIWQVFGAVTALVLLIALWLWWRWRVRRAKAPPLPQPALDHLRSRLAALQPQAASLTPAALGHQVGDVIRTYLQREHGLLARYRTTEELFGTARGPRPADAPPPLPFLRPFEDVFARCDAMKFAGAGVLIDERASLLDRALAAAAEVNAALARRPPPPVPAPTVAPADTEAAPPPLPEAAPPAVFAVAPKTLDPSLPAPPPLPGHATSPEPHAPVFIIPAHRASVSQSTPAAPPLTPATPRSDSFTHPQTAAFARGADVIPV